MLSIILILTLFIIIFIIIIIIKDYDSDNQYPALGFGARIPPDAKVGKVYVHCELLVVVYSVGWCFS